MFQSVMQLSVGLSIQLSSTYNLKASYDTEAEAEVPIHKRSFEHSQTTQLYVMCYKIKEEDFSGILHQMNSSLKKQLLAKKNQSIRINYNMHTVLFLCFLQ